MGDGTEIEGFPTLIMYKKETNEAIDYNGKRDLESIVKFIETGEQEEEPEEEEDDEEPEDDDDFNDEDFEDDEVLKKEAKAAGKPAPECKRFAKEPMKAHKVVAVGNEPQFLAPIPYEF